MGKYPVTVGEFGLFVKSERYVTDAERKGHGWVWAGNGAEPKADASWKNSYLRQTPDHPVVLVSWHDAQRFLKWLDGQGDRFQFPTEAQWEYAYRAGTETRFYFGDDPDYRLAPSYAWYEENSGGTTHPVGRKKPNAWSLYDMVGNTKVWVADWYGPYAAVDQVDPTGPRTGADRVRRGGCFMHPPNSLRATLRTINKPSCASFHTGFRVALTIPTGVQGPPTHRGLVLWLRADKGVVKGADGLVSKWEDLSGKGNHANQRTPGKRPKWGQVGDPGRESLIFDGATDFLQIPHSDSLDLSTEMTVAAWIWPGEGNRPDAGTMVAKYQWVDGRMLWGARYRRGGEGVTATIYNPADWVVAETPARPRTWSHFAFVFRPNLMRLYVNGRLDAEKKTPVSRIPSNRDVPVTIGWGLGGRGRNYFRGAMDDIRLYDRALTDAEIQAVIKGKSLAPKYYLANDFEVPKATRDKYGNPIRKGTDQATGLPLEIRHKKTGMHLVFIPAGEFMMGSEKGRHRYTTIVRPVHKVRLTRPFYLGKYEVTQAEWVSVMDANPSHFRGDQNPVEQVSWSDCQDFVKKLSLAPARRNAGATFSLPTEAQWEYACRSGTTTAFHFGEDPDHRRLGNCAWHHGNSGGRSHTVGQKEPNPWGLYDITGNVWEWCSDWYGSYTKEAVTDPTGPTEPTDLDRGGRRVARGGAWNGPGMRGRSADRSNYWSGEGHKGLGCRVALAIPDDVGQGPPIPDGLVLYYPFDRAGERAEDKSGKGNHGTLHGVKWTVDGKIGGAYEFDGRDDYIEAPDSHSLDVTGSISLAAWIRLETLKNGKGQRQIQPIVAKYDTDGRRAYHLSFIDFDPARECRHRAQLTISATRAPFNGGILDSDVKLRQDAWHHVVGVFSKGSHMRLYIDGADHTGRFIGELPSAIAANDLPLRIGRDYDEDGTFDGTIDEVMIFNRALSAEEVRLLAGPARLAAAQRPLEADPPAGKAMKGAEGLEAPLEEIEEKAREDVDKEQPPVQEGVPGGEAKDPADAGEPE